MKRSILSLLLSFSAAFTSACFEAGNMSVQIKETGLAENVLSVRALTGDGAVHLEWELPSDAKGVSIRRDTRPPFSVTSGTEIYCGPDTSYIDADVETNKFYYYLVVAIDQNMNFAGGVNVSASVCNTGIPTSNSNNATNLYAYDENFVYICNLDTTSDWNWNIRRWGRSSGALDTAFGTNGVIINNPSDMYESITTGTIDGDFIYLAGYDSSPGINNSQWRVEKRNKNTGALDTSFDGDGILEINPSTTYDYLYSLIIEGDYIYLAGYDYSKGENDCQGRLEKRNKNTGALDASFDGDGILEVNPSNSYDVLYSLIIDGDYIYLAGFDCSQGDNNRQWRVEKISKNTGAHDTSFDDDDGILEINPSEY